MRRYERVEALAVLLMGLLLAAVLYTSAGCSERRNTYNVMGPTISEPAPAPGDSCPVDRKPKKPRKPKGRN